MPSDKFNGLIITILSLTLFVSQLWYSILDPMIDGVPTLFDKNEGSYWALAIPITLGTFLVGGLLFWIGWTMFTTKPPRPPEEKVPQPFSN